MKIISIKTAKARGLARYFSGQTCIHGHTAERWVSSRNCVPCHYIKEAEFRASGKKTWAQRNPDRAKKIKARWKQRNPEAVREDYRRQHRRLRAAARALRELNIKF